ncbi:A/G-specific adenine glycosylase [Tundrisphaera lichenicola]|uniref:A/G-specific adenine glycosylase n=1 Tax=Tundrisphaera lichenicola TaxID=2029860 RepID=UPI003EB7BDAA
MGRKPKKKGDQAGDALPDIRYNPVCGNVVPDADPEWIGRVRRNLVAWYEGAHRPLPWREDRDPYRILVSEMMLVQTTVAAVIPYFGRFLDRFPTVEALADADEADVLKSWEGLGYYRRARQLHTAARVIVGMHGGVFPDDPQAILALPGVGRYIAGALLSFAFDRPAPIVEANTQRVLARWLAWDEDLKTTRSQARLWEAAGRLVPESGAGIFNQAFMELGALVCLPKAPLCLTCPISEDCLSRKLGVQDQIPRAIPKVPPKEVAETGILVCREGRYLIVKRGAGRLWEGFWEFPTLHVAGPDPAGRSSGEPLDLAEGVSRLTGVRVSVGPVSKTIRFGVTTHKVTLEVRHASWLGGKPVPGPGLVDVAWEPIEALGRLTMSSPSRRIIDWLSRGGMVPESESGRSEGDFLFPAS